MSSQTKSKFSALVFEAKEFQEVEIQLVFHASAGLFAGDNVPQVGNWEDVLLNCPGFGIVVAFDAIGSKNEIEIKGPSVS